jgi:glucose/arabinose dehydrogenase
MTTIQLAFVCRRNMRRMLQIRRRLVVLLPLGILLGHGAMGIVAEEPTLAYSKQATRQATYEAALREAKLPVFGPWHQVGPFDPLLRRVQGPDENYRLDAQYDLYGGGRGTWREMPAYVDGAWNAIDTSAIKASALGKSPTVYLRRTITAPAAGRLRVFLGADGHFILTLGGKQVHYAGSLERFDAGQETAELPLVAGENVLLLEMKLAEKPCRFFCQPNFGAAFERDLYAKLDADFPLAADAKRPGDFREVAARSSTSAEDAYYRLVEIEAPAGATIEGTGLGMLPDGRLAVATRRGYVYLVKNPGSDNPKQIEFKRFAEGLHEPLGLGVVDGQVLVVNRGEVTRLLDTDGDGKADEQQCVTNDWGVTGNYHEYAYGLPQDARGNLYVALNLTFGSGGPSSTVPYRGCVLRIAPDGKTEPVAVGLRSPNGIGRDADGEIFVTDNQGDWVAACPLYHVKPGSYFGVPPSLPWAAAFREQKARPLERSPPAVWFPYDELCQSATDILCDTSAGKFGPFAGQLFVGEMTKGLIARVALEKVGGEYQGACFLFRRGLGAVNRLAQDADGNFYFARVNRGWGGGGLGEGLARLEFTGRTPLEMHSVHLLEDGFEIRFTKPVAAGVGDDPTKYRLEQYGYHYWKTYGSPRIDLEPVEVRGVAWSDDRRSVRLTTSPLKAGKICKISAVEAGLRSADGDVLLHAEAFYTVNRLP